jgi:3-phosphoshikimate 1-carboxyvinyltransferase
MTSRGTIRVPGDKSISHRALILGALADGRSRISAILNSADVNSTAGVLRSLGIPVPDLSASFSFAGKGLRGLTASGTTLDAGNSGTTVRLMSGVAAAHPFSSRFEGDESLSRRPMKRIAEPLSAMGASFEFARGDGLPMTIHGCELQGISWNTRSASAQTKSAILLAGLCARVQVSVIESAKSRDHTERMLTSLGAPVEIDDVSVSLSPVDSIAPLDLTVPGDPSSAAYFIAYAVLSGKEVEMPGVCVNSTRTGFIDTMMQMGARIGMEDRTAVAGDAVATIVARGSELSDFAIDPATVPSMIDELPLLACVAAQAGITLEVTGARELRVKESDRISVVARNLRALGAVIDELPDGFVVRRGRSMFSGKVTTEGDHRIAMSFGVLAALPGNAIAIDDPDCVAVSYPGFWDDLKSLS